MEKDNKVLFLIRLILKGILAGGAISIGCCAYVLTNIKFFDSFVFTIGLFIILTFDLNLFTGMICNLLDSDKKYENNPITTKKYILILLVTLLSNLLGSFICALLLSLGNKEFVNNVTNKVVLTKMSSSYVSMFIKAIFCNILIFVAVKGFKGFASYSLKILSLFFGVTVFVICGFEHCIADMFYFMVGINSVNIQDIAISLSIIILGNIIGALFISICNKICLTKK